MQKIVTSLLSSLWRPAVAAVLAVTLAPGAPEAQGLFSPAITVNGRTITQFELEQRIAFLQILNAPGDPVEQAREALIDDRLKQQEIEAVDLVVAPEDVQAGIEEFAARGNLPADEFLKLLGDAGVSAETVRDFIEIQLAWRDYVAARFGARARPSDSEIDRALGQAGVGGGVQVLLSEIIIPVTPQTVAQVEGLAQQIAGVTSFDAFSAAAAQYSASDTRNQGGRLNWMAVTNLPPALQPVILGLTPGEVTSPLTLPNAVALFQMRGIREAATGEPRYAAIDYAAYFMAGGRSPETLAAAAELKQRVDTCDDLYAVAKGQLPEVLERESKKPGEIPRDMALELAKLDRGEVSTALTRNDGQTLVFLMLCGRTTELVGDASREQIAQALTEQRLATFSESYLAQLRADAIIEE